jgi:hypothetical protein
MQRTRPSDFIAQRESGLRAWTTIPYFEATFGLNVPFRNGSP